MKQAYLEELNISKVMAIRQAERFNGEGVHTLLSEAIAETVLVIDKIHIIAKKENYDLTKSYSENHPAHNLQRHLNDVTGDLHMAYSSSGGTDQTEYESAIKALDQVLLLFEPNLGHFTQNINMRRQGIEEMRKRRLEFQRVIS